MKNKILKQASLGSFFILTAFFSFGQKSSGWSTNPFDENEFIENKGQFPSKYNESGEPILFAMKQGEVNIYFSAKGVTWRHDDAHMKEEEHKSFFKKKIAEEEEIEVKTSFVHMNWENSNPNVTVVGDDAFAYYRTYGDVSNPQNTFVVNVFKKIIYKNIYPNIDVEYYFPKNQPGIKYNVILHPGANASQFKMKYFKAKNVSLDGNGNIVINSDFGPITDHAPSSTVNGQPVASSFSVQKNIVSFNLQSSQSSTIIIDPWVTNPGFTSINKGYDVDYDKYGNVFCYGGVNHSWTPLSSFELVKIDNTGAIKWKYSTNLFSDQAPSPGDFFVDYNTGRSYIFEGENLGPPFNAGNNNSAEAIKLDAAGNLVKFYIPANPAQSMTEFSRVNYNCATNTAIATGGGVVGCYQAATFDTSLNNVNYLNVLASQGVTNPYNNAYHDMALLTSDNAGNCYMLANRSYVIDPLHADNYLFQASMTAPQNNIWGVSSNHHFIEEGTGIPKKYGMSSSNIYLQNGYNGIAVNCNFLCTSDGHIMKKWDKNNGNLLKQAVISPDSLMFGGLDISHCDHIYAGYYNTIKIFDSGLNPI